MKFKTFEQFITESYENNLLALGGNVVGTLRQKHGIKDKKALDTIEQDLEKSYRKIIMSSGGVSAKVHKWLIPMAKSIDMDPKKLAGIINSEINQLEV